VDSVIAGGGQESAFNQRRFAYNFATRQEVEKTGGDWLMIFNNNRRVTNNQFSTLNPSFSTLLSITYTQPLLRDLSLDANRRTIQLNKRNLDISDSAFRQRVIEIISQVQRAYWDLVFSIRNEGIAREAVQLAKTQLENNRKMVEAGTLAPIELRSNEAALESRKEGVILALQGITTAENALKGLLINDPNDKLWSAAIEPTDEPQFGQSTHDLDEATRLALSNRPELEQTKLQIEQNDIDIKFFKNRLKPQLDLFATYSNSGLAGTARVPDRPPVPGEDPTTPPRLLGGFGQALSNLFSQDFRTYEVGVRISLPWRNRDAKGNLGRSLAESRQLDARQRQLVQNIQIEVRNALQSVEAARQRFEAQRANRIASDAQFKGELERFRAGLSTNFLVLTRQNELSVAKGNELRALTDYNKALADLRRVTGLTLVSNNIEIPQTQNQGSDKK
jgi:HAE1 family hydrophobic/amphiphilic exporter-1